MRKYLVYISLLTCVYLQAQNTVGLLHINKEYAFDGYNLIYPNSHSSVYLLDHCGQVVHEWPNNENSFPGANAVLLENGSLLRASNNSSFINNSFGTGGSGGLIEILSWDNELLWQYILADTLYRQHHQIAAMPNGNILALAYELHDYDAIIKAGFDTLSYPQQELYSETIIEINPENDSIVWQWRSWDHLVQDFDPNQDNYANILQEIGSININYQNFTNGRPDFMHANSLDYNEELDQILISVRNYSEIWIIDHSTTTLEASTDSGGKSGQGGRLIYRWGNPETYDNVGNTRKLFNQHDAKWIDDEDNAEWNGKISLFNNNVILGEISLGHIIEPEWDAITKSYVLNAEQNYFPNNYLLEFAHPNPLSSYSGTGSSFQALPNGNVLMNSAVQGRAYELDINGELIWEYRLPMQFGGFVEQGTVPQLGQNFLFQLKRYGLDYPAFSDKNLTPGKFLEINPNLEFCDIVSSQKQVHGSEEISVFPNPSFIKSFYIQNNSEHSLRFLLVDSLGRLVKKSEVQPDTQIELSNLESGLFFLIFDNPHLNQKLIVK